MTCWLSSSLQISTVEIVTRFQLFIMNLSKCCALFYGQVHLLTLIPEELGHLNILDIWQHRMLALLSELRLNIPTCSGLTSVQDWIQKNSLGSTADIIELVNNCRMLQMAYSYTFVSHGCAKAADDSDEDTEICLFRLHAMCCNMCRRYRTWIFRTDFWSCAI